MSFESSPGSSGLSLSPKSPMSPMSPTRQLPVFPGIPTIDETDFDTWYPTGKKVLAKGEFGNVLTATDTLRNNKPIAIKQINMNIKDKRAADEVFISRRLIHSNVVAILDSFELGIHLCIVMELAVCDLRQLMSNHGTILEPVSCYVIKEVLKGLAFIHQKHIVHRDISPSNILIYEDGACKIGDFGDACLMVKGKTKGFHGCLIYMAPEVMRQKVTSWDSIGQDVPYDQTVDIWSIGCVLYEMIAARPPIQTNSLTDYQVKAFSDDFQPYRFDPHLRNMYPGVHAFIKNTINMVPAYRWSASKLLQEHPWILEHRGVQNIMVDQLITMIKSYKRKLARRERVRRVEFWDGESSRTSMDFEPADVTSSSIEQPSEAPAPPSIKTKTSLDHFLDCFCCCIRKSK